MLKSAVFALSVKTYQTGAWPRKTEVEVSDPRSNFAENQRNRTKRYRTVSPPDYPPQGFRTLIEGERVEFEVVETAKGYRPRILVR